MRPGMKMFMLSSRGNGQNGAQGSSEPRQGYTGATGPMGGGNRPGANYRGQDSGYARMGSDYGGMGYEASRNERGGVGMNDDAESRFRDRRGREHYDDGRFAPMRGEMGDGFGVNRRGRGGGGYGPRGDMEGDRTESRWSGMDQSITPYVPPVYEAERPRMNKIGFSAEPSAHDREYRQSAEYSSVPEGDKLPGAMPMMGYGRGYGSEKLTKEMAEEWTKAMQNEDGSKGPHWTMDQAKQVMTQKGIQCDPMEFWAVLCSLYSDYSAVLKKHNVNNMDLYVDLAAAWLNDKDAVKNKAAAYFEHVVRR